MGKRNTDARGVFRASCSVTFVIHFVPNAPQGEWVTGIEAEPGRFYITAFPDRERGRIGCSGYECRPPPQSLDRCRTVPRRFPRSIIVTSTKQIALDLTSQSKVDIAISNVELGNLMSDKVRLSGPTLKVLKFLLEKPREGQSGADMYRETSVGSGTLYPLLARLERVGWVTSQWEDVSPSEIGRPRRRLYRLTALGQTNARNALLEFQVVPGAPAWNW
jgi:PadR family transcriptional regulator, regulatory protein PadR